MERMKLFLIVPAFSVLLLSGGYWAEICSLIQPDAAFAQEGWLQEFEDICAKTQDAMVLSIDELKNLITRCDTLKPLIEKLPETQKKVYLKRLQTCRDLYVFVLDTKRSK